MDPYIPEIFDPGKEFRPLHHAIDEARNIEDGGCFILLLPRLRRVERVELHQVHGCG